MKRQDLEEMRLLGQELVTLREEYLKAKPEEVGDTYGDYRSGKKVIKVMYGYSSAKRKRLERRVSSKADELCEKMLEMEAWLDGIDSTEIRDILRLYYAVGMTQTQIADRKGYERSSISKKIERFWQKQEGGSGNNDK